MTSTRARPRPMLSPADAPVTVADDEASLEATQKRLFGRRNRN